MFAKVEVGSRVALKSRPHLVGIVRQIGHCDYGRCTNQTCVAVQFEGSSTTRNHDINELGMP